MNDWGGFFRQYRPLAVRFATGLVAGDEARAEDLVQEAARALFERAENGELTLESRAHARNYFMRSVHNLAVSGLRRGRPGELPEALEGREEDPRDALEHEELTLARGRRERDVQDAVADLPEPERRVLGQRFGDGLSFREISEREGVAISTLHSRVGAALKKIRDRIGKDPGDA
jgi:RNA polymerase sigma factor (sigma-70 family)